jgi:hypothetical protein
MAVSSVMTVAWRHIAAHAELAGACAVQAAVCGSRSPLMRQAWEMSHP